MANPTTPDNRIRFSSERIDFDAEVGATGQDHDLYPAPAQQPRFDWMRMFLIGLLSQQSSYQEPTQFRDGTPWFDLNDGALKIRRNDVWVSLSEAIMLGVDSDGQAVMLNNLYESIKTLIGFKPTATFSGHSTQDAVAVVPIPEALRTAAGAGSRPFVFVDGLLVDPRRCEYVGGTSPVSVRLTGGEVINIAQGFTVLMLAIDPGLFSADEVLV